MVKPRTLAEVERPDEPIARGSPELGERRLDRERLIELDQAVEDLLRDGSAVDVPDSSGIEGLGILPQRSPVNAVRAGSVAVLSVDRPPGEGQRDDQEQMEGGPRTPPPSRDDYPSLLPRPRCRTLGRFASCPRPPRPPVPPARTRQYPPPPPERSSIPSSLLSSIPGKEPSP